MDKDAHDILIGIAGSVGYAVLAYGARFLVGYLTNSNPLWRRQRLVFTVSAAIAVAASVVTWGHASPLVTTLLFSLLICATIFAELNQFWRIGLMGADRELQSGIDHAKALDLCQSSFTFLGIGASKLTGQKEVFERAIDRCDNPHDSIRFLLSRPDADGLERIARMAGRDRAAYQQNVQESLRIISRLKLDRSKNIEVRFYKEFPAFRLLFLNNNICLASHYVLGKGTGSDLPQLHIVRAEGAGDKASLYYGFDYYFNSLWQSAETWDFRSYI